MAGERVIGGTSGFHPTYDFHVLPRPPGVSAASNPDLAAGVGWKGSKLLRSAPAVPRRLQLSERKTTMWGLAEITICLSPALFLAAVGAMVLVMQRQKH